MSSHLRILSHVGFIQRAAAAIGFTPITKQVAANLAAGSPWSDNSHLAQVTLQDLYGLVSEVTITRARAMRVATVAKGRRIIAGNIGRLTLNTMKGNAPAAVQPVLLAQPEKDCTLSNSLTWLVDDLMFYPRAWWIVQERDSYGWPIWVKRLPQGDAGFDAKGKLTSAWGKPVADAEVIEFQSIDAGLLVDAVDTIRRAIAINLAAAHAEDNPVPSIDLHNDGENLEDEEIDVAIQRWVDARKTHGVGYSSKGLKVNTLGLHPEQLLIDGRKAINLELVRHIGIPAWAADVPLEGSTLTYLNRGAKNWELIDLALATYMTAISSRLSMPDVTPRGWRVEFNTDDFTRPDMKTRFEAYKIGVDGKFVTQDQIAAWEGWETTTGTPS